METGLWRQGDRAPRLKGGQHDQGEYKRTARSAAGREEYLYQWVCASGESLLLKMTPWLDVRSREPSTSVDRSRHFASVLQQSGRICAMRS